ncbi:MAG: penicillin-binding protein activator LpoB [Candidatus Cloacimonetes bacterium]|nr:penicillin-binding protein activator LpoB [Candidatus Cloacimonadota bacterium]
MKKVLISLIPVLILLIACAPTQSVARGSVDQTQDLSGYWNAKDIQQTAEQIVRDVLGKGWLSVYKEENDRKPRVIVGRVRNLSSEHLDTKPLVSNIQTELINSGKVSFVASKNQRGSVREEREDQQYHADEDSAKRMAAELGADFELGGEITTVIDSYGGKQARYYNVKMQLINIETNEIVWQGQNEIIKFISKSRVKW